MLAGTKVLSWMTSGVPPPSRTGTTCTRISSTSCSWPEVSPFFHRAWRERLNADLQAHPEALALIASYKDADLAELMTELGGHCLETLLEAFDRASQDDAPRFFIAYTVKGLRLPFQGHKDNHAGLMTPTQIAELRDRLGVVEGQEWDPLSGLSSAERTALKGLIARAPFAADVRRSHVAPLVTTPSADELLSAVAGGGEQSTQAAFGKVMFEISRRTDEFSGRVVTTSPDVTVSTNLGGFVNRRGVFHRRAHEDVFKRRRIPSAQVWSIVWPQCSVQTFSTSPPETPASWSISASRVGASAANGAATWL